MFDHNKLASISAGAVGWEQLTNWLIWSILCFLGWNYLLIVPIFDLVTINFWQAMFLAALIAPTKRVYVIPIRRDDR